MSSGEDGGRLSPDTLAALDSLESLWEAVEEARSHEGISLPTRPPSSVTAVEYAQRYGIAETSANRELKRLVKSGLMQHVVANVPNTRGRTVRTNVYIPIKKP